MRLLKYAVRTAVLLLTLVAVLTGCAAATEQEAPPLPLADDRPTFAFFYTDN
jgi:hypothetical protein